MVPGSPDTLFAREVEDLIVDQARRQRLCEINSDAGERAELEAKYGQVWDTTQLAEDFEVTGFMAPFVVVTRKSDRKVGSLEFQHHPRLYFNFKEHVQ